MHIEKYDYSSLISFFLFEKDIEIDIDSMIRQSIVLKRGEFC